MKCPHCNQEHSEGTKFCPETGMKIPLALLNCPNKGCKNFGKYNLPIDTRFCPDCGTPIQGVLSDEDISINGIVLGQTTLREMRLKGFEIENDDGMYTIDIDDDSVYVHLFNATYREVEEFGKMLVEPSALNRDFILNRKKTVSVMGFDSFDGNLFNELGLSDDCDEDEIIEILEERGYMQIENLFADDNDDDVITFVRERKDTAGNTIFLRICDSDYKEAIFFVNLVNEWKSYKTGDVFYA